MSAFLDGLEQELVGMIETEVSITMQVAVLMSMKVSKREIQERLGIDGAEVTMCTRRLEMVGAKWRS